MSSAFAGFGERALELYEGLHADNSRTYWQAHLDVYRADVAAPLAALAEALTAEFGPVKTFRPNRDVRFSADKRPYQEHAALAALGDSGTAGRGEGRPVVGGLYAALSTDGLFVAGGYHRPARDQLERFRTLQDDAAAAADLDALLADLAAAGYPLDDGEPLRTAPRGWARDHPRISLLRRTSLTVSRTHEPGPWLFEPACLDVVLDGWRTARRWCSWLDLHVGAGTLPDRVRR